MMTREWERAKLRKTWAMLGLAKHLTAATAVLDVVEPPCAASIPPGDHKSAVDATSTSSANTCDTPLK